MRDNKIQSVGTCQITHHVAPFQGQQGLMCGCEEQKQKQMHTMVAAMKINIWTA